MSDLLLTYYRDQLQAVLHCDQAGCTLTVGQPSGQSEQCPAYWLEVLLQPTDPHGWPQGRPRPLFEVELPTTHRAGAAYSRGWLRLPFRLGPELLLRCHLRLTCRGLAGTPPQTEP